MGVTNMMRDEMQRFLDLPEIMSLGELGALRKLMRVIGIQYNGEKSTDRNDEENEKPGK